MAYRPGRGRKSEPKAADTNFLRKTAKNRSPSALSDPEVDARKTKNGDRRLSSSSPEDVSRGSSESPNPHDRNHFEVPQSIDWRGVICRALGISSPSDKELLDALKSAIEMMEEAERIKASGPEAVAKDNRHQTIHRVQCNAHSDTEKLYQDVPWVVQSGPQNAHLRGSREIYNLEVFLERNKDVTFIAYKDYQCCGRSDSYSSRSRQNEQLPPEADTLLTGEVVSIVSDVLSEALQALAEIALEGLPYPSFDREEEFDSPFLWWFHRRQQIVVAREQLDEAYQEHINTFDKYIQERFGAEWAQVDDLIAVGQILPKYISYLYVPQSIVISNVTGQRNGQQEGYRVETWLVPESLDDYSPSSRRIRSGPLQCSHWVFDGNFQEETTTLTISWPSKPEPFSIAELKICPLEFIAGNLRRILEKRGNMFWECRRRNYVFHNDGPENTVQNTTESRFMVDIATYKQMHPIEDSPSIPYRDGLSSPDAMSQDEPPQEDSFILCLPNTLPGFNMQKKEWTELEVSCLTTVRWNTKAFDTLAIEESSKELVSALVTNQIDAEKATDLMSGKGNGLFILLHGPPGSGKTLTAESVAEYAKKPLYRVTCGDIGTKAEDVEKYLEVVLLLGKSWGCVVLLDEADVFLEQRTINDLARNALVSVFLRVLEYYDGILILTSNRVGIFDEAFRSRIQLTMRYKSLEPWQRVKIWDNFITRLEGFEDEKRIEEAKEKASGNKDIKPKPVPGRNGGVDLGVDTVGIRMKLEILAKVELNGREIRNVISTARQLAMFRKMAMGYEHLYIVIQELEKFDVYMKTLKGGFSAEQIAMAEGDR